MEEGYKVKSANGENITLRPLLKFNISGTEKEYIVYSLIDDNDSNKLGAAILGEIIYDENNNPTVLGIEEDERKVVMTYYNEIMDQLGGI